jgi:carbonic anhydrase
MTAPLDLIEGFRRFRERHFTHDDALYRHLVTQGQTPRTLVVGCCDSRVDPAIVFDCAPGDLFVVRNVANLVPPREARVGHHGTSAALEYGVRTLNVQRIIVLGHARCGGIRTLVERGGIHTPDSFIDDWMHLVEEARAGVEQEMPGATLDARAHACEQRALLISLSNLTTFPWVKERIENGTLSLHGWYFDIEHGQLLQYDAATGRFEAL